MQYVSEIANYADEIEEQLIHIRRRLHERPELSMQEYHTSQLITEELKKIPGMLVQEHLAGGTGVIGILEGRQAGKCSLLRADIDALSVTEHNHLEYCSKVDGVMHACGHDAHITWVLGCAMILSRMRSQLPGTVKFLFQPGEEIGKGAVDLIEHDKVLESPEVDQVFAAHVWPTIPSGKIGIARHYAFGCPGGFQILVKGVGGHGSWPHQAINPILVASQICTMFPQILSDRIDPVEPRVISICSIHAGETGNSIPDTCEIKGTLRATKPEIMQKLIQEVERVVKGCCQLYGSEYEIDFHTTGNAVHNDSALVELCQHAAEKVLGVENCSIIEKDNLGGDNFSEFSNRKPGAYLYIGTENPEIAKPFQLHSPNFVLDESILKKAAAVFAQIIFDVNEMRPHIHE